MVSQQTVQIARNRDKARIGLPPSLQDDDNVVWIIGTKAQFRANPVKFDRVVFTGLILDGLSGPTDQRLGIKDDQPVIQITVPDLPGAADLVDEAADAASLGVLVGTWVLTRRFKEIARNQLIIEIQKIRLNRAKQLAALPATSGTKRFRATIRAGNVGRSIVKRSAKQTKLVRKTKSLRFIATRVGAKVLFKGIFVVSLAIDIVLVSHRTFKGAEEGGVAGGIGGLTAGIVDVLTFGLIEKQTDIIEVKTTSAVRVFFERIGGLFRGRFVA